MTAGGMSYEKVRLYGLMSSYILMRAGDSSSDDDMPEPRDVGCEEGNESSSDN